MKDARISVISIPVSAQIRARDFYTHVLGFELMFDEDMGNGSRWVMLRPSGGGASITLVTWLTNLPAGSLSGTILAIPDIEEAVAKLKSLDVAIAESEIQSAPWGRWVTIKDPDGNGWIIQQDNG